MGEPINDQNEGNIKKPNLLNLFYWNGTTILNLYSKYGKGKRFIIAAVLWLVFLCVDFKTNWTNNTEMVFAILEQTSLLICITIWLYQAQGTASFDKSDISIDDSMQSVSSVFMVLLKKHSTTEKIKRAYYKFYHANCFHNTYRSDTTKWLWFLENARRIVSILFAYIGYIASAAFLLIKVHSLEWNLESSFWSVSCSTFLYALFGLVLFLNMFTFVNTFRDILFISKVSRYIGDLKKEEDYNQFNPAYSRFIQDLDRIFRQVSIVYSAEVLLMSAFCVTHVLGNLLVLNPVELSTGIKQTLIITCVIGLFMGVMTALMLTIGARYYLNKIISRLQAKTITELGKKPYEKKNQRMIENTYGTELKKSKTSKIAVLNFVGAVLGLLAQIIVLYIKTHGG